MQSNLFSLSSIFTNRNEVVTKVIFLHLFVILFPRGGSASMHAGIPTPPGADPPRADTTPRTRHPPRLGTPPDQALPRPGTLPRSRHPPGADPPGADTPPGSKLQHTVYERPVCILLECILVSGCLDSYDDQKVSNCANKFSTDDSGYLTTLLMQSVR